LSDHLIITPTYKLPHCRSMKQDYERIQGEEGQLRREARELEKAIALTKHDLKEVGIALYVGIHIVRPSPSPNTTLRR